MSYYAESGLGAWYDYLNPFATKEVNPESIVGRILSGGSTPTVTQAANVALPEATTDQVTAARTCANAKAYAAGYAKVIEPNILGANTCGLLASKFGEGCVNRDLVMNTCVQRGLQFAPPVPASVEAQAVDRGEEPSTGEQSFWQKKETLYLVAAVLGGLVFMKMRQKRRAAAR